MYRNMLKINIKNSHTLLNACIHRNKTKIIRFSGFYKGKPYEDILRSGSLGIQKKIYDCHGFCRYIYYCQVHVDEYVIVMVNFIIYDCHGRF
jgi:hypothetical protein